VNAPNESGSPQQGDSANGRRFGRPKPVAHRATPGGGAAAPRISETRHRGSGGATRASHPRRAASEPSGIDARLNRFISGTSAPGVIRAREGCNAGVRRPAGRGADGPSTEGLRPASCPICRGPNAEGPPQPKTSRPGARCFGPRPPRVRSRTAESREARGGPREVREARKYPGTARIPPPQVAAAVPRPGPSQHADSAVIDPLEHAQGCRLFAVGGVVSSSGWSRSAHSSSWCSAGMGRCGPSSTATSATC